MRVALLLCLLAFSSLFAFSNAGCSTKGDALKVCEMLVGRQNKNPDDDVNTYCGDYEKDLERELCLAVIASGLFEEGFNGELCKAEANKKYLSDFVICEEEDEEGNGKGFLELQTALMKRGSRNKASTTVAACGADPKSAALNLMGKPVNVIIDPPWTNAKLNKERPYSEPPNRLTVGAANTGCELHPEGAYAFCPNGGINPNNAGATNCVDANGALHTAACGNNAIGAHVGNFFGAGGYLDTYFGGAPVTMTHPGSVKNPSSFLWAVDMCGNIKMGDENQDRQAPAAIANRANAKNRAIKHGDLIPTPNGDRRGKGRVGGEIRRITKNGTTAWVVNGCSSYSTLRERAHIPFATSSLKSKHLCHAMAHLNAYGFDTANAKLIKCNKWYHNTWNANCLDCTNPNAPVHTNCF